MTTLGLRNIVIIAFKVFSALFVIGCMIGFWGLVIAALLKVVFGSN